MTIKDILAVLWVDDLFKVRPQSDRRYLRLLKFIMLLVQLGSEKRVNRSHM